MCTGLRRSWRETGEGEAARGFVAAARRKKMQILSPPHPARHKGGKPAHEGCALPGILRQKKYTDVSARLSWGTGTGLCRDLN